MCPSSLTLEMRQYYDLRCASLREKVFSRSTLLIEDVIARRAPNKIVSELVKTDSGVK